MGKSYAGMLLTSRVPRFIVGNTNVVASPSVDRPLAGQHVALLGRLSVLSKRDARVLVERLGGTFSSDLTPRTTVVVSAAMEKPVPSHVHRVLSEDDLCREAGLPDLETLRDQYYSARDLRGMYPHLRDDHLRYLEKWGLVRPAAGRYSFSDLHVVRQAATAIRDGAPLHAVLRGMVSERDGQLAFDFQPSRTERAPARVVSLPSAPPAEMTLFAHERTQQIAAANHALAAKYFLEGAALDDGEERDLDAAAASYRRAALFDPQLVPAIVNLANIHYGKDELAEAQALYERAISLDDSYFEAHFNLGNIHLDHGRYAEAEESYRNALALNHNYADAHFYLAVTLEKMGRSIDARSHWKAYERLAPNGEWVELAREFSD